VVKQEKSFNKRKVVTSVIFSLAIIISIIYLIHNSSIALAAPSITKDSNLKVETLVNGLSSPTSMAFIDNNNILVLEKGGQVRLVSNGVLQDKPVLQVSVDTESERGLLGIAIMNSSKAGNDTATASTTNINNNNNNKVVFLYYTESNGTDFQNRVYRYNWNGQTQSLINPTLILDLPALPGPNHDGGKLAIGPNHYLYAIIGDLNHRGKLQNIKDGPGPDNTSAIFRVKPNDGSAPMDNPFIKDPNNAMHKYYAYGVRNSFGITFDPLTGNLWQTENGAGSYDEINLVKPGFNSGWIKVMGPLSRNEGVNTDQLVNFPGSHYTDPVFSWKTPVAVTDIEFLKSLVLGEKYKNNIFVGDYNNGNLYYFEVNGTRTGIKQDTSQDKVGLSSLIVDDDNQLSAVTFGTGFGGISDIETGPKDGFLYILSINDGSIYRIVPSTK
jgi:aldose sugar dehydrogenase